MTNDNVIYAYTRDQAIEDGVLVDVSEIGKEAGFNAPVAITAGVHALCEVPKGMEGQQHYQGRLWDVVFLAIVYLRSALSKGRDIDLVEYKCSFQMQETKATEETLWLMFNNVEGFTIMKPEEY